MFLRLNAFIWGQLAVVCLQHVCDVSGPGHGHRYIYLSTMAIHAATDHELCKCKRDSCGVHFIIIMKWLSSIHIHMCVRTLLSRVPFFCTLLRPLLWPLTGSTCRRWMVYRTNSWGYLKNGTFDGMIGALVRKEIDVGGSPIFFRSERAKVIDYTARTWISRWVNCKSTHTVLTTKTSFSFLFVFMSAQ